ncbi:MAG: hypothetical protein KDD06_30110 [Phaeodactylibacter sp.]|nr:hypothetical protein [Phaeodactylibacter sp.]MCB9287478.1 hypothetical protein [Lewinellaceae bacterium]
MKSPFKFLDAYTLEDREVFFGREEEVRVLYELVRKNRLILVYGRSGTGKTSLIQCGLASQFDVTDWYPISIRRVHNINESLEAALYKTSGQIEEMSLVERVEETYVNYLRPVYLIFDQLEELLILGTETEQRTFIESVAEIIQAKLPCRIMFVLREEYLGYLYNFERVLPNLFDCKLRVEPMNYKNVARVIEQSCNKFNVALEDPEQGPQYIIDKVSDKRQGISLPYLQVYLDALYLDDYRRTYSEGEAPGALPPLEFKNNEIQGFGDIREVLEKFLKGQQEDIQALMASKHPGIPDNLVWKVLDTFVTEDGTKQPFQFTVKDELFYPVKNTSDFMREVSAPVLTDCIRELERRRILAAREETYEVAHDMLAEFIDQERSGEERERKRVLRRLKNQYEEFKATKEYLTQRQLLSMEEYLPKLNLSGELKQFVADSMADAAQKEQAEKDRLGKEAKMAREKLEAEQKASRHQRWLAIIMSVFAVVALALSLWAFNQKRLAKQAEQEAVEARDEAEKASSQLSESVRNAFSEKYYRRQASAIAYMKEFDFSAAKVELLGIQEDMAAYAEEYKSLADTTLSERKAEIQRLLDTCEQKIELQPACESLGREGDEFFRRKEYLKAKARYEEALGRCSGYDPEGFRRKIGQAISTGKQYYIDEGDAYFRSDYRLGYQKARSLYEDALEIGGPDPELKKKIDACEEKLR